MHTPSPVIESPRAKDSEWGDNVINPQFNLKPGTKIQLIVRALPVAGLGK
jgi:hypothetical protein